MQIVGWCRLWEASKFRVYHVLQPLQNGYLVGMWINIVQVGPSINGAGILSVARGKYTKYPGIISYIGRSRRAHMGTSVNECVNDF